jgi:hypothetical protein
MSIRTVTTRKYSGIRANSSNTYNPAIPIAVDYLVVGPGGNGGGANYPSSNNGGGGGGSGGAASGTANLGPATRSLTITVGLTTGNNSCLLGW